MVQYAVRLATNICESIYTVDYSDCTEINRDMHSEDVQSCVSPALAYSPESDFMDTTILYGSDVSSLHEIVSDISMSSSPDDDMKQEYTRSDDELDAWLLQQSPIPLSFMGSIISNWTASDESIGL